jgi:poly(hydroxyalkanoate) granule-associated protein
LGAFAKAQEEGGRVFSKLVKEGTDLQKRTQKLAENKASGVTETVTKMVDDVSKQASGSWDKLEQIFEDRVVRALSSIGVPTRSDVDILTRRIEQLSNAVAQLTGKSVSGTPKVDDGPKAPVNGAANGVMKKPVIRKSALKVASKASVPVSVASAATSKVILKPAAKPAIKSAVKPAVKPASKAAPKVRVVAKPVAKAIAGSGFPTTESVSKAAHDKQAAAKSQVK